MKEMLIERVLRLCDALRDDEVDRLARWINERRRKETERVDAQRASDVARMEGVLQRLSKKLDE